jgi:hypothetical protein
VRLRLALQALIGAKQGTFDLNAIENRKRGFGAPGSEQRPNLACLAQGRFTDGASIRCWVDMGGRKVARKIQLIRFIRMYYMQPAMELLRSGTPEANGEPPSY